MKLGTIIEWLSDISEFRHQVRLADELGYDIIGVGDTPARAYELYVSLTIAAEESRHAILTPLVTTPFLRHPAVTASAVSALHELTGGRAMVAIGGGGSAVAVIGRGRGATQTELGDYATAVREVLNGRTARVDGRVTKPLQRVRPMPVYLAADHPNSLQLAGEIGDGVIITVGMSVDLVKRKVDAIRDAAGRAGRDPDAIEIWGFSYISVCADRQEANEEIGTALATDLSVRLRRPHIRSVIPATLLPAVEEMEGRFNFHDPEFLDRTAPGRYASLLKELGLVDFALDLMGVTGDVDEVAAHLKRLESAGLSGVFAALPVLSDPDRTLRGLSAAADRAGRSPADRQTRQQRQPSP